MHEHSYIGCEHELKHCKHCDVVYCEKCQREWKQQAFLGGLQNSPWQKSIGGPQWPPPSFPPGKILCQHS